MTIRDGITGALVLLTLGLTPAAAQTPAPAATPLLVDAEWLSQHLNDRDLVILQVGDSADYATQHIPGARLISDDDLAKPHDHSNPKDLMLELPDPAALRAKVASFGISDDSRIVVYFGKNGGVPSATRVIFTLAYLGLGERTSLLNGGVAAWTRAGKTLTAAVPPQRQGTLRDRPVKALVTDATFVKTLPGRTGYRLVDARAPVFYNGIQPTMADKSGHIPGAVNIPFTDITDDRMLIDRDRLTTLFNAAGVKAGDTVVVYCHIGQQATAVILGARLLGHPVMLYDGAFQDWAVNNRGPVEK